MSTSDQVQILIASAIFAACMVMMARTQARAQARTRRPPRHYAPAVGRATAPRAVPPTRWGQRVTPLDTDWLKAVPVTFRDYPAVWDRVAETRALAVAPDVDPAAVIAAMRRTAPVRALALPAPRAVGMSRLPSVAEFLAATA
jgi:hypothetical protein